MKIERIKEFVEDNFKIHTDWTGSYVEAKNIKSINDLIQKLNNFINNDNSTESK